MPTFDALLLGGGSGSRYQSDSDLPKQFTVIGDAPVLVHCYRAFLELGARRIALTVPAAHEERTRHLLQRYFPNREESTLIVVGGSTRTASSRLGLQALAAHAPHSERVLIHDLCRPYLSTAFRQRILATVADSRFAAWIPGVAVTETLKRVHDHTVQSTLDRAGVYRVQTPQIFDFPLILALATKAEPNLSFTDDASLCEHFGEQVGVFAGDPDNVKLTFASERQTLEAAMKGVTQCESASAGTSTA